MRHLLIVGVWLLVYFIPTLINPESAIFYTNNIFFSVLLVFSLLFIDKTYAGTRYSIYTVDLLIVLTTLYGLFNLFTQIGYLFNNYILYDIYASVCNWINGIEALVLIIGTALGAFADRGNKYTGMVLSDLVSIPGMVLPFTVIDLRNKSIVESLHRRHSEDLH